MKFPNQGGMGQLLAQAQKMQQELKVLQDKLSKEEYSLESAGGRIKVTVNGKNEVLKLTISKELMSADDADMLADMVKVAINQALGTAQKKMSDEMGKIVPPGMAGMF
jgi:hypothetical protein